MRLGIILAVLLLAGPAGAVINVDWGGNCGRPGQSVGKGTICFDFDDTLSGGVIEQNFTVQNSSAIACLNSNIAAADSVAGTCTANVFFLPTGGADTDLGFATTDSVLLGVGGNNGGTACVSLGKGVHRVVLDDPSTAVTCRFTVSHIE